MASRRLTRLLQALFITGLLFLLYQAYYLSQLQPQVAQSMNRRRPPLETAPRPPSEVPLGVAPHWAHLYWHSTGGDGASAGGLEHFQCGGRTQHGKLVDWRRVNDDFCDCGPGVEVNDEPATGACPGTFFVCTKNPTMKVPSSQVNDGICDCCDGSDEARNVELPPFARISKRDQHRLGVFQTPCEKHC